MASCSVKLELLPSFLLLYPSPPQAAPLREQRGALPSGPQVLSAMLALHFPTWGG